jgi:hypothetical protein
MKRQNEDSIVMRGTIKPCGQDVFEQKQQAGQRRVGLVHEAETTQPREKELAAKSRPRHNLSPLKETACSELLRCGLRVSVGRRNQEGGAKSRDKHAMGRGGQGGGKPVRAAIGTAHWFYFSLGQGA